MTEYKRLITEKMHWFASNPKVIFLGQQVGVEDFYGTLKGIPEARRLEMPVAEELQLGMSIGMALEGYLPISIFQRIDFLPRACDQLVNHLDLIKELSDGKFNPKVIIRTTVGSTAPLDVGLQHNKDLCEGFSKLLRNIKLYPVKTIDEVNNAYNKAYYGEDSIIIVEYQDCY